MGGFLRSIAQGTINTAWGPFVAEVFAVGGAEAIVLHTDNIPGVGEGILCRIQSECVAHAFYDQSCDCGEQISTALRSIRLAGAGLLIYLRQEGMGLGMPGKLSGALQDWRGYDAAVAILQFYGVHSVELLSLNVRKIDAIRRANIALEKRVARDGSITILGKRIARVVEQVRRGDAVRPIEAGAPFSRVLVLGDLNVDRTLTSMEAHAAGTGYNAALALKETGLFTPIIFGKVGRDEAGSTIRAAIEKAEIDCLLGIHETKSTGLVKIFPTADPGGPFQYEWDKRNNANDYDAHDLAQAIELMGLGAEDYAFVSSYLLVQKLFDSDGIREILILLGNTRARLVLDLVRKSLAPDVLHDCGALPFDASALKSYLEGVHLHAIVGELTTFDQLGLAHGAKIADGPLLGRLQAFFECDWVVCRYINNGRLHQRTAVRSADDMMILAEEQSELTQIPIGHGDKWFAQALGLMRQHTTFNLKLPT
jgi:GTP cyclohydrolase II